jgi:DNA polymerase I-like protein with 3'-5' exonuclease and polymerase domains
MAIGKRLKTAFLAAIPAYGYLLSDVASAFKSKGFLKGLDGRQLQVRSEHSAVNTLLQSAGALVMKQATIMLWDMIREAGIEKHCDQAIQYHDEFQLIVKEESLCERVGIMMEDAIVMSGEYFKLKCPLAGSYKIGTNWAETH